MKNSKRVNNNNNNNNNNNGDSNKNIQSGYWIEFGTEKCSMRIMRSGKRQITEGMELPDQERIKTLGEKESYKNFGILEMETIKQVEMKEKKSISEGRENCWKPSSTRGISSKR